MTLTASATGVDVMQLPDDCLALFSIFVITAHSQLQQQHQQPGLRRGISLKLAYLIKLKH